MTYNKPHKTDAQSSKQGSAYFCSRVLYTSGWKKNTNIVDTVNRCVTHQMQIPETAKLSRKAERRSQGQSMTGDKIHTSGAWPIWPCRPTQHKHGMCFSPLFIDTATHVFSLCGLTTYAHIKSAQQRTITHQYGDWNTGRWWVGCYIWYSEERPGRAGARQVPSSLYQM